MYYGILQLALYWWLINVFSDLDHLPQGNPVSLNRVKSQKHHKASI